MFKSVVHVAFKHVTAKDLYIYIVFHGSTAIVGLGLLIVEGFEIALRHTTLDRTALD